MPPLPPLETRDHCSANTRVFGNGAKGRREGEAREMAKIVNLFVRHAFLISRIINED